MVSNPLLPNYGVQGATGIIMNQVATSPKPKNTMTRKTYNAMVADGEKNGISEADIQASLDRKGITVEKTGLVQGLKNIGGGLAAGVAQVPTRTLEFVSKGGELAAKGLNKLDVALGFQQNEGQGPTPSKGLAKASESIKTGIESAVGSDPNAVGTKLGEIGGGIAGSIAMGNAVGLGARAGSAFKTAKAGIQAGKALQTAKGIGQAALVGGAEGAMFDVATQGKITKEGVMYGTAGGAALAGLPVVGKAGGAIARGIGAKSEKLAVRGLVNVKDAKKVLNSLGETSGGDVGSMGRWLLEKKVLGGGTDSVIGKIEKVGDNAYNAVRSGVKAASSKIGELPFSKEVDAGLSLVSKQIEKLNTSAGYKLFNKPDVKRILDANKAGKLNLNDMQKAKELLDEFVNMFSKSGDVLDTQLAKAGSKIRNNIKKGIEEGVYKATKGKVDVRSLNRDVAIARTFQRGIEAKNVSNSLRQYFIQSTIGGLAGAGQGGFDFTNPSTYVKALAGILLGQAAGRILSNPMYSGKIAKIMDKMSFGTRKALLEYSKAPEKGFLPKKSIDELLNIKDELKALPAPKPSKGLQSVNEIDNTTKYFNTNSKDVGSSYSTSPGGSSTVDNNASLPNSSIRNNMNGLAPDTGIKGKGKPQGLVQKYDSSVMSDNKIGLTKTTNDPMQTRGLPQGEVPPNRGKSVSEEFYHGTNTDFDVFKVGKQSGEGSGMFGKGVDITTNKNVANNYARSVTRSHGGKENVLSFGVKDGLKIYDFEANKSDILDFIKGQIPKEEFRYYLEAEGDSYLEYLTSDSWLSTKVADYIKSRGYDGLKYPVKYTQMGFSKEGYNYKIFEEQNVFRR